MTLYRYFMVYYDGMSLRFELREQNKRHQKIDCHTLTTLVLPQKVKQVKISKDIYTRYPNQSNQKHTAQDLFHIWIYHGSWYPEYLIVLLVCTLSTWSMPVLYTPLYSVYYNLPCHKLHNSPEFRNTRRAISSTAVHVYSSSHQYYSIAASVIIF